MDYVPHTPEDLKQIMKTIGISSMDDLFDDIPEESPSCGHTETPSSTDIKEKAKKIIVGPVFS